MISWSNYCPIGNERKYLIDAFESGWVSGGDYISKAEELIESFFPSRKCLLVSNGTSALQLAFQALQVKPGDKVLVPSFCFQAAGNVLYQLGAEPLYYDVHPTNWGATTTSLLSAGLEDVVGIVLVHNYGIANSLDSVMSLAREAGVWVVEDCAESWFSGQSGTMYGSFGDVATFSMHATKSVASGEGGAVLFANRDQYERAQLLRSHGLNRGHGRQYHHQLPGNNFRLSNILAALALAQLECHVDIKEVQSRLMRWYENCLSDIPYLIPQQTTSSEDLRWAYAVSISFSMLQITRDELVAELLNRGVEVRIGFVPACSLSYTSKSTVHSRVAKRVSESVIVLPCSRDLTYAQVEYICATLRNIIQENSQLPDFEIGKLTSSDKDINKLASFIDGLTTEKATFRYFSNRDFEIIDGHEVTLYQSIGDKLIGYGHLELEGHKLWLGITVSSEYQGHGLGKLMMWRLIFAAVSSNYQCIYLRVDKDNIGARALYESFGFEIEDDSSEQSVLMKLVLDAQ